MVTSKLITSNTSYNTSICCTSKNSNYTNIASKSYTSTGNTSKISNTRNVTCITSHTSITSTSYH